MLRDATKFGASCPQPAEYAWPSVMGLERMREDCLFVNVVTPEPLGALLPVAVYLHAGEFQYGSSQDSESNWPFFAENSLVYVTLNSRLGPLGFLAARGALLDHSQGGGTGNFGMLDQQLALRWVRRHIACFGGDPDRVTILGESSGGSSVALHLVSPTSWGMFKRAVLQSPGLAQVKLLNDAEGSYRHLVATLRAQRSPYCEGDRYQYTHFGMSRLYDRRRHDDCQPRRAR